MNEIIRMAKKSGKTTKNKKKKLSFAADLMRRLLLMICAVLAIGIGGLYLYDRFSQQPAETSRKVVTEKPVAEASTKPNTTQKATTKQPEKQATTTAAQPSTKESSQTVTTTSKPSKKTTASSSTKAERASITPLPKGAELPQLKRKRAEQVIQHEGYTVSYNADYRIANWVAYVLTDKEARSDKAERQNKFVVDPLVKGASATNEDYTRTGFDRGHLAPAGDMKWSEKAMRESFYLSNITPQKPGLNRGIWKELEEQIRLWARENGAVLIATGPVIPNEELSRLGKNRVGVPRHFYKVLCMVVNNRLEGVGFLFENRDYGTTPLRQLMVPIDSVEQVTGIDFFQVLPDAEERQMEATVHTDLWSFCKKSACLKR